MANRSPITNRNGPSGMVVPSKLTPELVAEIKRCPDKGILIAKRYGISQQLVSGIRKGRVWKSVDVPVRVWKPRVDVIIPEHMTGIERERFREAERYRQMMKHFPDEVRAKLAKTLVARRIRNRKWVENNQEKNREFKRAWTQRNPLKKAADSHKRRARILGCDSDGSADKFYTWLRTQKWVDCYYCGKCISGKKAHADHIIAVTRQGDHKDTNLCAACPTCNQRKNNKLPSELQFLPQPLLNL